MRATSMGIADRVSFASLPEEALEIHGHIDPNQPKHERPNGGRPTLRGLDHRMQSQRRSATIGRRACDATDSG